MSCQQFEMKIALYVEDDLPVMEIKALEEHLSGCLACKEFLSAMRESQQAVMATTVIDIDDQILNRMRIAVMEQITKEKPSFWQRLWGIPWRYAFATLLLIVFATLMTSIFFLNRADDRLASTVIGNSSRTIFIDGHNAKESVVEKSSNTDGELVTKTNSETIDVARNSEHKIFGKRYNYNQAHNRQTKRLREVNEENNFQNANLQTAPPTMIEIQTSDPNIRIIWFVNNSTNNVVDSPMPS